MSSNKTVLAVRWMFVFALALFALPSALFAQYENGSVVGSIHDSAGAAIASAQISITNNDTGITATITADAQGNYDFPQLRVGVYTISATAPTFSRAVAQNITVSVGVRQHIDLTLKVGAADSTVEVSDVTLQVESESSQRDQTITNYQTEGLPLVNRNYSDLLGLVTGSRQAPTAATTSSINSLTRQGAYNINGQRSMFNNFLLDGMDNNAYGESNQGFDNQIIAVPPDSVTQFAVVTNNESAEYGRSSGATINVATQSGSNKIHATLYEFFRNTALNATGFFKPTNTGGSGIVVPFKKPTLNRNQFGVNFGAPIIHDKLFFFGDYEGFRQVLKPLSVFTLPTLNELNGILTVPVRNPLTGVVYPAGTPVPAAPLSQQIINAFRQVPNLPTAGLATTGLAQFDYAVQVPFRDNADKGDIRFDFQQNPSTAWFLRISDRKENALNAPALPLPLDGQTNGKIRILDQQVALGFTRLFGSSKILDARVGLSRTKAGKFSTSIGSTSFNIPGLPTDPAVAGGLPSTSISGFSGFGRQSTNPQFQNPALLDPKVNFTYVRGKHSFKFGYEYEHVWMAVSDNNPLFGSFTFGGGYSACTAGTVVPGVGVCSAAAGTPQALSAGTVSDTYFADFLFGTTSAYSAANEYSTHLRQTFHNAYIQDDWKVLPSLTLNLGLRYEYGSPYSEQHNAISNFDPISQTVLTTTPGAVTGGAITARTGGNDVYSRTLVDPDLNDFAPRVGFAFAPDAKTSVRGGFGTSYVHYTRAGSGDILGINAPQALFVAVNQNNLKPTPANRCAGAQPTYAQVFGANGVQTCYVSADQGFPVGLNTNFNPLTDNVTYVPRHTRDSYVESYFLSVQREFAKNTRMDVAYVANHGLKLQGFVNVNQLNPAVGFAQANRPFPGFSDITTALNEFSSNYNSLQVRYEQRFVAGLTLLNSFTWSHALDQTSASLEGNTPSVQDINNLRADYGQSDYNLPLSNVTSILYELPVGHGRRFLSTSNGFLDAAIGGWQASVINTMQSGTPFNLTYTPAAANQVSPTIANSFRGANLYRPNLNPGVNPRLNTQIASSGFIQYVNPAAFSLPATTVGGVTASPFGNLPRNYLRNTPFYQTDLALNKRFATPIESLKIEFRTEAYNLLNHTNLYLPSTISGTNGATATGGGIISSTFTPRVIQFALKVIY